MGIKPDWDRDFYAARAALEWQVELGATEAIGDVPVNCYDLPDRLPKATPAAPAAKPTAPPSPAPAADSPDAVAQAHALAEAAPDLDALQAAIAAFDGCDLKLGARNLVFADGQRNARVMIVGEAPGRDEDRQGKPFVGEAGQLLDRMLAAISMGRDHPDPARAVYITNLLPWHPPSNRDPSAQERAMFRPFVLRHIELINPDLLVLMGRISASTMLETPEGITKIRGQWRSFMDRPCLPMFHPAYLLRNPPAKREAWADLLSLQAKLRTLP